MKTKKVVIGIMTAAIFSLTLNSFPVTFAADETVQISVGSQEVQPGEEFSVDVTFDAIPSPGIQACDFSIVYDNSLITVTDVKGGTLASVSGDSTSSMVSNFESYLVDSKGRANVVWSTAVTDSSKWLNGRGVFCTITGKASSTAANGTKAKIQIVATTRESYPDSGMVNSEITAGYSNDSESVKYKVETVDGVISIGMPVVTTTTATTTVVTTNSTTTTTVKPVATTTEKPITTTTVKPVTTTSSSTTVKTTTTVTTTDQQPIVTTTTSDSKPSVTEPPTSEDGNDVTVYGDADEDGDVNVNDAVKILSYVSNSKAYPIGSQGLINADVYSRGDGVSNLDALSIQRLLANIITSLPESWL